MILRNDDDVLELLSKQIANIEKNKTRVFGDHLWGTDDFNQAEYDQFASIKDWMPIMLIEADYNDGPDSQILLQNPQDKKMFAIFSSGFLGGAHVEKFPNLMLAAKGLSKIFNGNDDGDPLMHNGRVKTDFAALIPTLVISREIDLEDISTGAKEKKPSKFKPLKISKDDDDQTSYNEGCTS